MPFPVSQELSYLGLAYFLVSYRWVFRTLCLVSIILGAKKALIAKKMAILHHPAS